jgi:hypothetical protein
VQLLLSGSDLIEALSNRTSSWYMPVNLIYTVLIVALAVFALRIMAAVRVRVTYPRSGYVHESGRQRRVVAGMALAILATATGVLALRYAALCGRDMNLLYCEKPALSGSVSPQS